MDNSVRDSRSNWLVAHPTLMGSTPHMHRINWCKPQPRRNQPSKFQHARQPPCLCGHSVSDTVHIAISQIQYTFQYLRYSTQYNISDTVHIAISQIQYTLQYLRYSTHCTVSDTVHIALFIQYTLHNAQSQIQYTLHSHRYSALSGTEWYSRPVPEWPHKQCVGLVFWRSHVRNSLNAVSLAICSPARTAVCNTWSSGGTALCRVGGATSQLDLPSLAPLSVAGCGWLQLGAPHWATSVNYCK